MKEDLIVSVAGIRGVYPQPLSPVSAYGYGLSFGIYSRGMNKVFVARDTRRSGTVLTMSLISGLLASGMNVLDLGIASTPQLTYLVEKTEGSCGAIVSASHNPEKYNGLKFVSPAGTFLNSKEGERFLEICSGFREAKLPVSPGTLLECPCRRYMESYFERICESIDAEGIRRRRFRVVADVCQGVGAFYTRPFLEKLGCEVTLINSEPYGVFSHNPEPLPENLHDLSRAASEGEYDIGFVQDPDGDRLALSAEDGSLPGEEMTLALAVQNILGRKKGPVVVNLSTSALVEHVAAMYGCRVYRTKIGEVNVVEGMREKGAVIGGEGNGGVILPDVHYGRDSFVGMALILELMLLKKEPVSRIISQLPSYTILKQKFAIGDDMKSLIMERVRKAYMGKEDVNLEDGIKITRRDGWIHIRPSGTEPVLRVYVEGKESSRAKEYMDEISCLLK